MPERFLGIDTSNYRTSAAIYNAETGEWVNRGGLLTVPEGAIGLRQSDALFQHTVRLHEKSRLCRRERCAPSASAPVPARWKARICRVFWQERASRGARRICFPCRFLPFPISRDISRSGAVGWQAGFA